MYLDHLTFSREAGIPGISSV